MVRHTVILNIELLFWLLHVVEDVECWLEEKRAMFTP
jgi:hypothetical protein